MERVSIYGIYKAYSSIAYVDGINGNDAAGYGTRDKPYRTLSYAIQQAPSSGSAIYLVGQSVEDNISYNVNQKSIAFLGNFLEEGSKIIGTVRFYNITNCDFIGLYMEQTSTYSWAEMIYYARGVNNFHNCVVKDRSGYSNVHYHSINYYNCLILDMGTCNYADVKFYRCAFLGSYPSSHSGSYQCITGVSVDYSKYSLSNVDNSYYGVYSGKYSWNGRTNSLYKLDLTGGNRDRNRVYTARNGVKITSSASTYSNSNYYYLAYLFDGTTSSNAREYWLTSSSGTQYLLFDFTNYTGEYINIDRIKICPKSRNDARSNYRVWRSDDGDSWEAVTNWVDTNNMGWNYFEEHVIGGNSKYLKVEVNRIGSWGSTLNEIEIWVSDVYTYSDEIDITTPIHKDDVTLNTTLYRYEGLSQETPLPEYRILINEKQAFPVQGFSKCTTLPYNIEQSFSWRLFDVGDNDVTIEIREGNGTYGEVDKVMVERLNDAPIINLEASSQNVHDQDLVLYAEVTDSEFDEIQYKISMGNMIQSKMLETRAGNTSDWMVVPLIKLSQEYTIEAMVQIPLNNNGSNWRTLTRGSRDHHVLAHWDGRLGVYDNRTGTQFHPCGFNINTLESGIYRLSAVGYGGKTDFYIDGDFVGTSDFKSSGDITHIGNYSGGIQPWGKFFDFRLWNKARTQSEIRASLKTRLLGNEPNLQAYCPLDGTTENLVDNDYNGTLNSGARWVDVDFESGYSIYPTTSEWTGFEFTPAYINYVVKNEELSLGPNTLILTVKDKEGAISASEITVEKYNNLPTVVKGELKGKTLYAVIDDEDGDFIQYRLLVNGKKVYPLNDWTKAVKPPFSIKYTFNREDIELGNMNNIGIEVADELGGKTLWKQSVLIDYVGILFTDKDENLYSTDIGEVIRYLDVGTIVAGDSSEIYQVWIKNNTGFVIENLELYVEQKELDPVEESVLISKTNEPFEGQKFIGFEERLEHGDKVSFFVRLETTRKALGGGEFDIWVSGAPVL